MVLRNPRGQKWFTLMGRAAAKDAEHYHLIRLISVILIGINAIVLSES